MPSNEQQEIEAGSENHPFLTPDRIEKSGAIAAELLLSDLSWIERRKDSVEILDDTALRRRVSVDFSLRGSVAPLLSAEDPADEDLYCAPIFVLPKSPANLMDFDLSDETGHSLRLQSKTDNARISAATIIAAAQHILGESPLEDALAEELRSVASLDAVAGKQKADDFLEVRKVDPSSQLALLRANERFRQWLWMFGHSSLSVVLFRAPYHKRKLIRLSYIAPIEAEQPLAAQLGLSPYRLVLDVPLLEARTFHFEATSPPGLRIRAAALSDAQRDEPVESDGLRRRVHLYRPRAEKAGAGSAVLWLAVGGPGFLGGAALASFLAFLALLACSVYADKIAANPTSAPALLLVLPGLIASYVARPDQHALTSRLLSGARYLLLAAAGAAYAAAGWVALGGQVLSPEAIDDRESQLLWVLVPLTIAVAAITVFMLVIRARADTQWKRLMDWNTKRRSWSDERTVLLPGRAPTTVDAEIASPSQHVVPAEFAFREEDAEVRRFVRKTNLGTHFMSFELVDTWKGCRVIATYDYVPRFRIGWATGRSRKCAELENSLKRLQAAVTGTGGGDASSMS